jgi:RimJ/RimL family protein N-acetyltransferase
MGDVTDPGPTESPCVREAREGDAEQLLGLQRALDSESQMMMLEEGERSATVNDVRARLRAVAKSPNSAILVAQAAGQLVGYVEAEGGAYRRTRHSAYVVIGVRRAWQGRGLGRDLLATLERWASAHRIRRLELTVRVDNDRARRLYERAGYTVEGVRRGSLLVDGEPVDELAMARLL